jgi:hypothetical protein
MEKSHKVTIKEVIKLTKILSEDFSNRSNIVFKKNQKLTIICSATPSTRQQSMQISYK